MGHYMLLAPLELVPYSALAPKKEYLPFSFDDGNWLAAKYITKISRFLHHPTYESMFNPKLLIHHSR